MTLFWLVVAVGAIVAEMMTGTLYLLVIGIAGAAGAALAWNSFDLSWQCVGAALVGVLGALFVRRFKPEPAAAMPQNLGGGNVEVAQVIVPGKLRVRWRGTEWDANGPTSAMVGEKLEVLGRQGNVLEVGLSLKN
ncbi:NfeD family protein [Viridibacterium curvum]|uniref:NfeD family protein n=1 Tax=Viridibacterium curvum TaxID=1101404 RepID=A0ABP9QXR5_9RHOO